MREHTVVLARLTRVLAQTPAGEPLPLRLCRAFTEIAGAAGGALSIGYADPERTVLAATDDLADRVENSQEVLREGPSLDAYRTGVPVTGLAAHEQVLRWPMLMESLAAEGPPALHAVPMRPHQVVMGVLTVHRPDAADLSITADEGRVLADAIGVAVIGGVEDGHETGQPWGVRDRVSQATGMVVAQLHLTPVDAMAVLRAHAFATGRSLADVSRAVLARGLEFVDSDEGGGV